MKITPSSLDQATGQGSADRFTGDVYIDTLATASPPSRVMASLVHFMPGARTAWHRHPLGQSLFVTEGIAHDHDDPNGGLHRPWATVGMSWPMRFEMHITRPGPALPPDRPELR